jgi:hypothetical protein
LLWRRPPACSPPRHFRAAPPNQSRRSRATAPERRHRARARSATSMS